MIMEDEIWKSMPNYEGLYEISSYSRIKSLSRLGKVNEQIFLLTNGKHKYYRTALSRGNKQLKVLNHRMAAIAFIPNPENKPFVNHIDGNKLNCYYKNLEWVTHSENARHAYRLGLKIMPCTKLSADEAIEIYNSPKVKLKILSAKFNVTVRRIQEIRAGKAWEHITNPIKKVIK